MPSANRAMRRRQARAEKKAAQLFKNGITDQDLQDSFKKGYRQGYHDKAWEIIRSYYAATMLALHEEYGFGQDRCIRALKAIETKLVECISNQELVEEAEKQLKIEINMDEAIDRAQPM